MSLGICILSFNHPEITARAVQSALSHGITPLLVHNGGERRNIEILKARFPDIQHAYLDKNVGYSGGVNHGLAESFKKHEWTLFLSNDCEIISLPKLPLQPAVVAPVIFRRKLGMVDSIGGGFNPRTGQLRHFRTKADFESSKKNGWTPYLPGSAFLVHKNIFESVGTMDSTLGTYWEDVDWSVRMQATGHSIEIDEGFTVLHRVGKTCHKNPLYSIYYFQRNRKRISWKYCPYHYRPLLAGALTLGWIRLGSRLAFKKRLKDFHYLKNAILD